EERCGGGRGRLVGASQCHHGSLLRDVHSFAAGNGPEAEEKCRIMATGRNVTPVTKGSGPAARVRASGARGSPVKLPAFGRAAPGRMSRCRSVGTRHEHGGGGLGRGEGPAIVPARGRRRHRCRRRPRTGLRRRGRRPRRSLLGGNARSSSRAARAGAAGAGRSVRAARGPPAELRANRPSRSAARRPRPRAGRGARRIRSEPAIEPRRRRVVAGHIAGLGSLAVGLTGDTPIAAMLLLLLLVGFYEEVVARGLLLTRARELVGGFWPPALISAVLFALGHFYQGVYGVVQTALF